MKAGNVFLFVLRLLVGAMFAVAGFTKLIQPYQNFLAVVHSYEIVGGMTAVTVARTLPWVELTLGVFLFLGLWLKAAAFSLWALNTAFIAVAASALWRKLPIEKCGCFGDALSLPLGQLLILDAALWCVLGGLFVLNLQASHFSLDQFFQKKGGSHAV